ncbi:succinylglutamate desuccinylase/aspartoacylase family protein [Thermoproteota archaeon]
MKNAVTFGDVTVNPGEIGFGSLIEVELKDCTIVKLPIIVLNGIIDGPKAVVSGAVHGSELIGAEVIRNLMREKIDPRKMRGLLIGIPISNPLGFQAGNRVAPHDSVYPILNKPGDMGGSITQRIGAAVWEEITSKMDWRIDIHGNSRPCTAFCLLSLHNDRIKEKNEMMAEATGLTAVYSPPTGTLEGMSGERAKDYRPVPSVSLELIAAGQVTETSRDLGTRAVHNVMKAWDMLDGEIEPQPKEHVWGNGRVQNAGRLKVNRGGILHFKKDPGVFIKKGETVAEIYNPYGDLLEEIKFPFDGYIRAWAASHSAVNTGSSIAYITHSK